MGQAKRRGSFETRKQQSIELAEFMKKEEEKALVTWLESLTPEQREEVEKKNINREALATAIYAFTNNGVKI